MAIDLHTIDKDLHSITAHQGGTWTIDAITNAVTVTATAFDIRALSSATDSVAITDGGGSITVDGTVAVSGDVNVTATNLDIRDLAYASDSVTAHQGGTWTVGAIEAGYASWKVSAATVASASESQLVASALTARLSVMIENLSSADIYIRQATGVTTANGLKIPKGTSFVADLAAGASIYAIASNGASNDIRIVEYAA